MLAATQSEPWNQRQMPDVRQSIRNAIQRAHRRLDQASVLTPLAAADLRMQQYQCAMTSLALVYAQIDDCLQRAAPLCPPGLSPYAARSQLIRCDLLAAGVAQTDIPEIQIATPTELAAYLGVRYVIEGSQLGNRVIAKNLQQTFGAQTETLCTFWLAHNGNEVWPQMLKVLALIESRRDLAVAIKAARATFALFETHLCVDLD